MIKPPGNAELERKHAGPTLLLFLSIIVFGYPAESRAGSQFLRVTDPGSDVHDLEEIIEKTCVVKAVKTRLGKLSFRLYRLALG